MQNKLEKSETQKKTSNTGMHVCRLPGYSKHHSDVKWVHFIKYHLMLISGSRLEMEDN